ncbi:MAG: glycoside hydrolase family 15 protein [Candidatus Thermoplasmatota archaeon]|nr:glycoside hydrolase family 15 protein [Candidatus Thermoplasmatota archaeon]MCL5963495.1 glycoside hydrolase family 15 protein [Candidatus Thermoplasmatota archaeon]
MNESKQNNNSFTEAEDSYSYPPYPLIEEHAMIGGKRTAALIYNGKIDWLCMPSFDSNAFFSSILDHKKGGYFSIYPSEKPVNIEVSYIDMTNILLTKFSLKDNREMTIIDFIPILRSNNKNVIEIEVEKIRMDELARIVSVNGGNVSVKIEFKPRFYYGLIKPTYKISRYGVIAYNSKDNRTLLLSGNGTYTVQDDTVFATLDVRDEESRYFILNYDAYEIDPVETYRVLDKLYGSISYIRKWHSNVNYVGDLYQYVSRSILILKSLIYDPTGAIIAAPTTSLPEAMGGNRNWDYRYVWLRDSSYVIEAFLQLGLNREATIFFYWLLDIIERDEALRPFYTINGLEAMDETELDLEGYMNNPPVRIGNGATSQLQIDVYGSIMEAAYLYNKNGGTITHNLWFAFMNLLERLKTLWKLPDKSIWEFRTADQHYVYSKVMAWIAFDRGIKIGNELGFKAPYDEWVEIKEEIKREVMKYGVDKETGSFVQRYGSRDIDGILLRIPLLGFVSPSDPVAINTVKRIEKELMYDGILIKRYLNADDLEGDEGAFLLLSFLYIRYLVKANREKEARQCLKKLLTYVNKLALLPEEIDVKTHRYLGNYPQALSHLGFILAAKDLEPLHHSHYLKGH